MSSWGHRAVFCLGVWIYGLLGALAQGGYGYHSGWSDDRLRQEIRGLGRMGSMLYIAAHPDDENTRLLSWFANEWQGRTAYLSLTRGDGGQNLVGSHVQYDLGVIRTQELLAARRVDRAEQFFTRANDFGYSKSAEETWTKWNKEVLLADMVWVIRLFQPDLIVTRFSPLPSGTHGHHTASAQLAAEAFFAAADSTRFPEQLSKVSVWQATRLVWNTSWWFYGKQDYDKTGLLSLNVGGFNPRLGLSYGEMAAESRSMHQSQGFGSARQRGSEWEYFQVLAGEPAEVSPLEGLEWDTVQKVATDENPGGPRRLEIWRPWLKKCAVLEQISQGPVTTVWTEGLMDLWAWLDSLELRKDLYPWDQLQLGKKRQQVRSLLLETGGLWQEGLAGSPQFVPGDSLNWEWQGLVRRESPSFRWELESISLAGLDSNRVHRTFWNKSLAPNEIPNGRDSLLRYQFKVALPANIPWSGPFWKADSLWEPMYTVPESYPHVPEAPERLQWECGWKLSGAGRVLCIRTQGPVRYKWTDPVRGECYRPVDAVPAHQLWMDQEHYYFRPDQSGLFLDLKLRIEPGMLRERYPDTLKVDLLGWPAGWVLAGKALVLESPRTDTVYKLRLELREQSKGAGQEGLLVPALFRAEQGTWIPLPVLGLHRIEYPHIPVQTRTEAARATLHRMPLAPAKGIVGYLEGAGDEMPQALRHTGYSVNRLEPSSLNLEQLKRCKAVVVGLRFYNTYKDVAALQPLLLSYVAGGGTLVVQYQTTSNLLLKQWGPYPLTIGRGRVTNEEAPVRFAQKLHPLLRKPNQLSDQDFEGWVQERGLYFAEAWDKRWIPLLGLSDPGEKEELGSLLVTHYGKGAVVYCALALFRQCPAGVMGGYRLLQNMVEYEP